MNNTKTIKGRSTKTGSRGVEVSTNEDGTVRLRLAVGTGGPKAKLMSLRTFVDLSPEEAALLADELTERTSPQGEEETPQESTEETAPQDPGDNPPQNEEETPSKDEVPEANKPVYYEEDPRVPEEAKADGD